MKKHKLNTIWIITVITSLIALLILDTTKIINLNKIEGWYLIYPLIHSIITLFTKNNKLSSLFILIFSISTYTYLIDKISLNDNLKILGITLLLCILISIIKYFLLKIPQKISNKQNKIYTSILGDTVEKVNIENLIDCNILVIGGHILLDLSDSKINNDININIKTILGGVEIILPKNNEINLNHKSILSSVYNLRKKPYRSKSTINITAKNKLSELTIK